MTVPLDVGTTGNPMSTAPKDGRFVRILIARSGWVRARWSSDLHCWEGIGSWRVYEQELVGWQADPNPLTRSP